MESKKKVYLVMKEVYEGSTFQRAVPIQAFESRISAEHYVRNVKFTNTKGDGSKWKNVDWFIEDLTLYLDIFNIGD